MKKETWVYKEKDLKSALRNTKKVFKPKFRWTPTEERYLLDNLPKIGLKAVSKGLRRSPVAVRSKFLRLTNIIDKNGRMTVSLKDNASNNKGIKEEYILIARELMKSDSRKVNVKPSVAVIKTNKNKDVKDNKVDKNTKNINGLVVFSVIMSSISVIVSLLLILKFIL